MIKTIVLPEGSSIKKMYELLNMNEKDLSAIKNFEYEALVEEEGKHIALKTTLKIFYKGLALVEINPENNEWLMGDSQKDWNNFIEKVKVEITRNNMMDEFLELIVREKQIPIEIETKKERMNRLKEKEDYDNEIMIGLESKINQLEDELQEIIVSKVTIRKENLPVEAYEALNNLKKEVVNQNLI